MELDEAKFRAGFWLILGGTALITKIILVASNALPWWGTLAFEVAVVVLLGKSIFWMGFIAGWKEKSCSVKR